MRCPSRRILTVALLAAMAVVSAASPGPTLAQHPDFDLHDGDVVVFLGDSNTASLGYHKLIENYTLMRFPDRHVRFVNAGISGDWAANAVNRLQSDVFDQGATVLFVTFAPNDLFHPNPGQTAQQTYNQAIIDILAASANRTPPIRVYVNTYPYVAPPGGPEPAAYYNMSIQGLYLSAVSGQRGIDVYNGMRNLALAPLMAQDTSACVSAANAQCAQVAPNNFLSTACLAKCPAFGDGLHMTDIGMKAMGFVMLRGLNAPSMVSSVTIDVNGTSASLVSATGATVTNLVWDPGQQRLSFDLLDQGQPLTFSYLTNYAINKYVPIGTIDAHPLKVTNLPVGDYAVTMRGQPVGTFRSIASLPWIAGFDQGVDLTWAMSLPAAPGGPWHAQNLAVSLLTDARLPLGSAPRYLASEPLPGLSLLGTLVASANSFIEVAQRTAAAPWTQEVVLTRVH